MGDRCFLRVTCRTLDKSFFEDIGCTVVDTCGEVAILTCDEANYGLQSELDDLALDGLCFHYEAGPGEQYGPCVGAAIDRTIVSVPSDWEGYRPVVELDADGEPIPDQLALGRQYLKQYHRVRQALSFPR